ncbi:sigma 54 modulation/S30EA ribosomal C-terminal domain-containing protein [Streptomyces sp. LP05-1]|uniref:Sigma 54 modulation/S30EA ribosomal C-terminal domain-containing protein n=1 Tax=Streptomyces pyxinae TaxID=2970734 RepID=A0ABT2CHK6_9ACTN|nr:sigma 54 modulation/S30EA ribosomal C-terminal domain-containing protein [Streptomyces sp. LP05-1]MCS0636899.1 sigma 54 modulation/S30EA ribosomal C-terminal domain-containing protein [Streptomyces sp. LP05-1]
MNRLITPQAVDVQLEAHGKVPRGAARYARQKVLAVLDHLTTPVLSVRIKLTQAPAPAPRPATARVTVDVNGRPVRAHVAADTMFEAVDLLRDRLRTRLARARRHDRAARQGTAHERAAFRAVAERSAHRPHRYHVPAEERRIVRHKSFGLPRQTAGEALVDLDVLDYDFFLFTEESSGRDSMVFRDPGTGRPRLTATGGPGYLPRTAPGLTLSTLPAPVLSVGQAAERLELGGVPFVFFADTGSGRGCVLYHRYDGHYGLITPAA